MLGLVPGIPDVQLDPDLVLLVFLPPLLYSAAFFADLRALRDGRAGDLADRDRARAGRPPAAVAVIAHELIGLPWAMSFALGAIVSPTDPAAATAIMRRVGAPRRLVNVLEGESLFNDATALVAYKVAVAAAVGASVSAGHTVLEFFGDAAGGIAIGLAVGWVIAEVRKRVDRRQHRADDLAVQRLRGVHPGRPARRLRRPRRGHLRRLPRLARAGDRLAGEPDAGLAIWSILTFLLNATLFILIGLQLPVIVDGLSGRPAGEVIGYAAAVCAAVIAVRFLWNFIVTVAHPGDRPPALAARAPRRLAHPGGRRLGGDARRGLAGGGAGAAAAHRRRRPAARAAT